MPSHINKAWLLQKATVLLLGILCSFLMNAKSYSLEERKAHSYYSNDFSKKPFVFTRETACVSCFDGWFMGISLGGGVLTGKQNNNTSVTYSFPNRFILPFIVQSSNSFSKKHGNASLFTGYALTYEFFNLGFEVFIDYSKKNIKQNYTAIGNVATPNPLFIMPIEYVSPAVKLNNFEYGLDFRPGLLITARTLLYAKIGILQNRSKVTIDANANLTAGSPFQSFPINIYLDKNNRKIAYRIGGGFEQLFWGNIGIRFEILHTVYPRLNLQAMNQFLGTSIAVPGPVTSQLLVSESIKAQDTKGMIGINYYW